MTMVTFRRPVRSGLIITLVALCSPLLVQDARAEESGSAEDDNRACLVKVREEMRRREVKILGPKVQETVVRLCSLGQTERALSFAFPPPSVDDCILRVRQAAVNDNGTLGREKISQAFQLCKSADVDRALAILEGAVGGDPVDDPPPPASPGPDLKRDIKVTFRTEFEGGSDSGKISGHVENKSQKTYGCVHLEFQLYTPSSGTRPEKGLRPLSTVGTEVRNVLPGSTVSFEQRLDCPVSLGLKTVNRCQSTGDVRLRRNTLKVQNGPSSSPEILSFRIEPQVINRGEWVGLFWEIEGAEYVLLYDDFGVLDSRRESGWASSMTGYQQEQLNDTTRFRLWAVGKTGCVSKSFEVTVRGKVID